jgi:PKD repeat protein
LANIKKFNTEKKNNNFFKPNADKSNHYMKQFYFILIILPLYLTTNFCLAQVPVADFNATPTTWQSPSIVNFSDLSTSATTITNWTWTFDLASSNTVTCTGCTGANAQYIGQNPPPITYTNPGLYSIQLTITNASGTDSESKIDFIDVLNQLGDCDTLDTQWNTPAPTPVLYPFDSGYLTGVPDPVNSVIPTDKKGVYERYSSPNPGTTTIGAIRVGLGYLSDLNDNMTFQAVVYDDDGSGKPGTLRGVQGNISPTQLGVPGDGFYNEFVINFENAPIPTTVTFHVGIEIFPGNAIESLVVRSSCAGLPDCAVAQGEGVASNHIWSTGFGYQNLLNDYGMDIDLNIIPILGESAPIPAINYTQNVQCNQTIVSIDDSYTFSNPTGISYEFSQDGVFMNFSTDPTGFIVRTYTSPGPDTLTIRAINTCGRESTEVFIINYDFDATPDTNVTQSGNVLTADQSGATYQWLDCDNTNNPISGETSQMFTATADGNYAVEITQNTCSVISNCYNVSTLNITENDLNSNTKLYPNPTTGNITLHLGKKYNAIQLKLFDITGKLIDIKNQTNIKETVFEFNANPGIYFLEVTSKQEKAIFKIIKQ